MADATDGTEVGGEPDGPVEIEAEVAGAVRAYLEIEAATGGDPAAPPPLWRDPAAEAQLWRICAGLEWFLNRLLRDDPGWNEDGFVDGVSADAVVMVSPVEVELRGELLFLGTPSWRERFLGRLRVAPDRDGLDFYLLAFGDADRGLGRVPERSLRRYPVDPPRWLFVLSGGAQPTKPTTATPPVPS